jgi:hypothetical protein
MRTHLLAPFINLRYVLAGVLIFLSTNLSAQTSPLEQRFLDKIAEYEAADRTSPPPQNAILLVGDSQFYRWKTLNEDLPGYSFINRAIDSFEFSDLNRHFHRLVTSYRPRLILVHVGGNDVHNGKGAERIVQDFETFVARVKAMDPNVPVVYSSITPGPGRWDEAETRQSTNRAIKQFIATRHDLHFIDLWRPMLTGDGKPREDLWLEDRVHPNDAGYRLRAELTKPFLGRPDRSER